MTGRSGGGAYSWYATALDDRIKAAVPVAGITNLHDHVVDGCVEGHCDCMYMVNTYRWDYPQLAALAAPRPLLISNTDRDKLFPFDGVVDIYQKARRLYELDGKGNDVALQMAAGPHEDLQVLQLYALQWFDQHLKGENNRIETAAKDYFKPEELKVFDKLPADQINTRVQETFVPLATVATPPRSQALWQLQRDGWLTALREKCFGGWPSEFSEREGKPTHDPVEIRRIAGVRVTRYDFVSQDNLVLSLYVVEPAGVPRSELAKIILQPLDSDNWARFSTGKLVMSGRDGHTAWALVAPRGIGPTQWTTDRREQIHIRRRFMLLGQTLDGMRVWDVRRAIQTLRGIDGLHDVPLTLAADHNLAGVALYAALFEPKIQEVVLGKLPTTHREGPDFLNVMRILDVPQTVAMVAEKSHVVIRQDGEAGWEYPLAVAKNLGWNDQIQIQPVSVKNKAAKSVSIR